MTSSRAAPHRAASEQDVIDQHQVEAAEIEGEIGDAQHGFLEAGVQVISVQRDVEGAGQRPGALDSFDGIGRARRGWRLR